MIRLSWLLLGAVLLGCRPADVPSSVQGLRVLAVDADPQRRSDHVLLRWEGDYDGEHALYALVDERGYRGLVESADRSPADCEHCSGPLVDAVLESGSLPSGQGAVAVGPVDGALPRARMKREKADPLDAKWRPLVKLDLDGDGRWDLEQVQRCGHVVRSGCSDEVCDTACTALTRPGKDPDPQTVHCASFTPDLVDCAPIEE